MADEAEKIAAGLSDTQRWSIGGEVRHSHGQIVLMQGAAATIRAFERKGLSNGACLLPLGLAVRKILQEQQS